LFGGVNQRMTCVHACNQPYIYPLNLYPTIARFMHLSPPLLSISK
jgi:hypothetical protein